MTAPLRITDPGGIHWQFYGDTPIEEAWSRGSAHVNGRIMRVYENTRLGGFGLLVLPAMNPTDYAAKPIIFPTRKDAKDWAEAWVTGNHVRPQCDYYISDYCGHISDYYTSKAGDGRPMCARCFGMMLIRYEVDQGQTWYTDPDATTTEDDQHPANHPTLGTKGRDYDAS